MTHNQVLTGIGAITAVGLYSYKPTRGLAIGVVLLIVLGIFLRFEPTIVSQFGSLGSQGGNSGSSGGRVRKVATA